jgi:selenide,water dikinase
LDRALCGISQPNYPNLLVDYSHAEDAGIYKINDELALVQTLDFFPPIVDDPFTFGQIAACNALSDIYAMGGTPKTAMSIVAFPDDKLDIQILRTIIDGALSKLVEAETALVGGHSISDTGIKFGLSVSGFVNPKKMLLNNTPRVGDVLILTKPLGTGVINTLIKADMAPAELVKQADRYMIQLNRKASEIALKYNVSCGTDITGFGLLGHLVEIIQNSELGIEVFYNEINIYQGLLEYIKMGLVPGGTYNNKNYRSCYINDYDNIPVEIMDILFDPQTSGGLLVAVKEEEHKQMLVEMKESGIDAYVCGQITDKTKKISVLY